MPVTIPNVHRHHESRDPRRRVGMNLLTRFWYALPWWTDDVRDELLAELHDMKGQS